MAATAAQSRRVGVHFTAGEFGTGNADHLPGLGALCALFLDPMRQAFGPCTVHSGYRSAARNKAVGGAPESHHVYEKRPFAVAADVSFARGTPNEWGKRARELAYQHGRGGVGTYATHVHVDLGPRRTW